ncbi:PspA/IM30 family protein [Pueribacillus sp. YX66]|uniref:PspA/IM30 family protein n=1 Tax=Pueribacillus sp. YX66 TaxID=3229242 RepID=UPI00358D4FD1
MVFKRIRDFTTATIHEWIDGLEDPMMMLKQYIRDMEVEIEKAERAIAKQKALVSKFQRQADEARKFVVKRTGQAQLAVEAGEEDLARQALHSKLQYEEQVQQYEKFQRDADVQQQQLMKQLHEMKERYQLLKDRKHAMAAKAQAVKSKESISEMIAKLDCDRIISSFSRIEDKIFEMEHRSKLNMNESYDLRMTKLEHHKAIEEELNKLKA